MKKLLYITAICMLLLSCEKVQNGNEPGSLNVTIQETTPAGAICLVEATNMASLEYIVKQGKEKVSEAQLDPERKSQEVVISGLSSQKEYTLIVKGKDLTGKNLSKEVEFTTEESKHFQKKVVIHKFTGSWCPQCPKMTQALDNLKAKEDNFYIVAVHCGTNELGSLKSPSSSVLESKFKISGYPTAIIDYYSNVMGGREDVVKSKINQSMAKNIATSGVSIETKVEGNKVRAKVRVDFTDAGNYKICCAMLEDNINIPGTVGSTDGMYHHVLRQFATSESGSMIGKKQSGDVFEAEYTFNINEGWKAENLSVIAYTVKEGSNLKFIINNSNQVKAGESVKAE